MNSGYGVVLTSDSFFYFVGQFLLWTVVALGATGLFVRRTLNRSSRIALVVAVCLAFISSLAPLFVRWAISMPGLGGPDAEWEEAIFSFSATFPQTVGFGLLMWVAFQSSSKPKASTSELAVDR